jgi:signal transduction histidine kinase
LRPARASLTLGVGRDLLVALIVCAVAVFVSLAVQLQISERELDERSLEGAAHYIAVHLQTGSDGTTYLPELPGGSWVGFAYASLVFDRDGRLLYERPATLDPQVIRAIAEQRLPPGDRPDRGIHYFRVDIGSQRVRGAALHTGSGAEDRVIEVFRYENAPGVLIDDMVRQFPYRSLLVLLPVFGLLLLAGRWILWRRMRPIAEVSAMAENIGPHTLRLRLPEANLPREVVPIIRGVNHALDRLERATEIQRQFLRRAAHQLRTPLMLVSARAATLERTDTTQALRGDVRELTRMVMQLLQLNEIEALDGDANRITDLGAVGEAVREEMAAHSAQRDKPIALTRPPEPVLVRGDPNVIEVAVRNLVENALRHAPTGSPIELRVVSQFECNSP